MLKIIIIGGGIAGLSAATILCKLPNVKPHSPFLLHTLTQRGLRGRVCTFPPLFRVVSSVSTLFPRSMCSLPY